MHCPKCNSELSFKQRNCDRCGEDLTTYKKIVSASNRFYNDGLTRARIRDLSGAIASLKKSLELDKTNTNARNLLGLVYYEMGEIVEALSQWVISKHFQPERNAADDYVKNLQQNPAALESINQTIKKYNQSLTLAKQGNEDLAIIGLKKVTSLNPKFIRAQQLLALLYMKQGENDKALKCLKKVIKVDINNTTSICYLQELKEVRVEKDHREERAVERTTPRETPSFSSVDKFQDDKPNIWVFLNLILGAVIGIAFAYFLIVPTVKKSVAKEYKAQVQEQTDVASSKDTTIKSLNQEIEELNAQLEQKDVDIKKLEDSMVDEAVYDSLFEAIQLYQQGKRREAAEKLLDVNVKNLTSTKAKEYYNTIKEATFESASWDCFDEAKTKYNYGNYSEAIPLFTRAVELNEENVDALYFLARSYDRSGDIENAKKYYNKVISDFPDSARVSEAETKLSYLGQ